MMLFVHRDCRVVKDMATGKSKGYGFVSFFNKWVSVSLVLERRIYSKMFSVDQSASLLLLCFLVCIIRMQRMPYSRWEDSGWEVGRSGPTGPQESLLLKLRMKVSSH